MEVARERFFEAQLKGEVAPSLETMEELFHVTSMLFPRRPWELLKEDNLILVKAPDSGELCFCMLMGSLGEVFGMLVFVGAQGYRLFASNAEQVHNDGRVPGDAADSLHRVRGTPRIEAARPRVTQGVRLRAPAES